MLLDHSRRLAESGRQAAVRWPYTALRLALGCARWGRGAATDSLYPLLLIGAEQGRREEWMVGTAACDAGMSDDGAFAVNTTH